MGERVYVSACRVAVGREPLGEGQGQVPRQAVGGTQGAVRGCASGDRLPPRNPNGMLLFTCQM